MTDPLAHTPAVKIQSGDHICALYTNTRERDDVLVPFLREGLRGGQKCLAALTDPNPTGVTTRLGSPDTVDNWLASGQLQVHGPADTISAPDTFSIDAMTAFWEGAVSAAITDGDAEFVRLTAEANLWLPQLPGPDELIRYEAVLNSFSARYPAAILCLYDVSTPDGGLIIDLVRTHSRLLFSGVWIDNPYFLPPEQFLTHLLPLHPRAPRPQKPADAPTCSA